jgi:hypothetical protein
MWNENICFILNSACKLYQRSVSCCHIPTSEVRVQSYDNQCGIHSRQSCREDCVSASISLFHCQLSIHSAITRDWNNRTILCRNTKGLGLIPLVQLTIFDISRYVTSGIDLFIRRSTVTSLLHLSISISRTVVIILHHNHQHISIPSDLKRVIRKQKLSYVTNRLVLCVNIHNVYRLCII